MLGVVGERDVQHILFSHKFVCGYVNKPGRLANAFSSRDDAKVAGAQPAIERVLKNANGASFY